MNTYLSQRQKAAYGSRTTGLKKSPNAVLLSGKRNSLVSVELLSMGVQLLKSNMLNDRYPYTSKLLKNDVPNRRTRSYKRIAIIPTTPKGSISAKKPHLPYKVDGRLRDNYRDFVKAVRY